MAPPYGETGSELLALFHTAFSAPHQVMSRMPAAAVISNSCSTRLSRRHSRGVRAAAFAGISSTFCHRSQTVGAGFVLCASVRRKGPALPRDSSTRGHSNSRLAVGARSWANRRWRRVTRARLLQLASARDQVNSLTVLSVEPPPLMATMERFVQPSMVAISQPIWDPRVAALIQPATVEESEDSSLPPAEPSVMLGAQQPFLPLRASEESATNSMVSSSSTVSGVLQASVPVTGDTSVPTFASSAAEEVFSRAVERDHRRLEFSVSETAELKLPDWCGVPEQRSKVLRVLDEMAEFYDDCRAHGSRWSPTVPLAAADTAEDLKQYLMQYRPRWAGDWHLALRKTPSLWRRVQLVKLRHLGARRLYVVLHSLDTLHRLLVLHVPVGSFDESHARLQASYCDDRFGRFFPGLRMRDEILDLLLPEEEEFGLLYRDGGYPFTHTEVPFPSKKPNYKSYDVEHADKSLIDLERQLERGYLEGPLLYTPRVVHPQGGVWNDVKKKYRPVVDATVSGLNETLVPLSCDYVALSDVVKPHTPSCYMSGFDLKDAFLLWPRSQHSCDLLGIKGPPLRAQYYRYRFSAMGVSDSPAIQSTWARILARLLDDHALEPVLRRQRADAPERLRGATARVAGIYVDDAHDVHDAAFTEVEAAEQFAAITGFLEHYGVEDSLGKREAPRFVKDFVGFEIDSVAMMVRVQPLRREKYRLEVLAFLSAHLLTAPRRELAKLLGKLQFCAPVARGLAILLAPLYRACGDLRLWDGPLSAVWSRGVNVPLPEVARDALAQVAALLDDASACERRIYSEPTLPLRYSGFWTGDVPESCEELLAASYTSTGIPVYAGDASGDGGGAHHLHHRMAWKYDEAQCAPHESSNFRELDTAVRPVEGAWAEAWAGGRVLNLTDNSTTVAVINRRGSMVPKLAALSSRLQSRCDALGIDIASKHVPGALNILADGLSRERRLLDKGDYLFDRSEFRRLDALLDSMYAGGSGKAFHTLDGCCDAAGNNRQVERFCSRVESLLTRSLVGERLWANVDFEAGFAVAALRHFIAAYRASPTSTSGTFVLPVWQQAPWWPLLKGARVLAHYAAGSPLFTSPDWSALQRADGTYGFGTARADRGVTRWAVMVAHFAATAPCRGASGASATTGSRATAARVARASMPTLRGEPQYDTSVLRAVPPRALL